MKKIIYILICCGTVFCSCKKNRICECKNTNNTYDAGELEATKSQAKKFCKDLSEGETDCYLKK